MLTPLGKYIKQLRLDNNNMLLLDMAKKLDKPASYISAIEYGRKNCPRGLLNEIALLFDLDFERKHKLEMYAAESKDSFKVRPNDNMNFEARTVAASFARKFSDLSEEQLKKLQDILDEAGT